jgi:antitoxin ParD1/3/4
MNVSLTPELEKLVNDEIESGQYKSASEVVREGLRLVRLRREKLAALRKELAIGLDQLDRGESVEYASVDELFHDIQAEVTKRKAKKPRTR